jgi:hypothetical protein
MYTGKPIHRGACRYGTVAITSVSRTEDRGFDFLGTGYNVLGLFTQCNVVVET